MPEETDLMQAIAAATSDDGVVAAGRFRPVGTPSIGPIALDTPLNRLSRDGWDPYAPAPRRPGAPVRSSTRQAVEFTDE